LRPLAPSIFRTLLLWSGLLSLGLFGLELVAFAQDAPPVAYYDAAIGKTGGVLKAALHDASKNHTVLPYTSTKTDVWDALIMLDPDPANSANVLLIYSGLTNLKTNQYGGGIGAGKWDREHLFPQSFGLVAMSATSRAKSDVFNLRPIDYTVNSTRGNLYYDLTTTPFRTAPGAPGSSYDTNSWEPRDADKGVVARAAFYMATRYDGTDADVPDLELSDTPDSTTFHFGKLSTLLAWNRLYPPTSAERHRNEVIYDSLQHNRNPFIDHPDYADMVFTGATPKQAWRNAHFTSIEQGNAQVSGVAADPDGDGVPNLLEYVFNRDPRQGEAGPATTSTYLKVGGTDYVYLSFPRNRNATDVTLSCENSTNLKTWSPAVVETVSTTVTNFETEQVTVRVPATNSPFFVRLLATEN
jgi:endonuclease I